MRMYMMGKLITSGSPAPQTFMPSVQGRSGRTERNSRLDRRLRNEARQRGTGRDDAQVCKQRLKTYDQILKGGD